MESLSELEFLVLNSTCDDDEDLERIYGLVATDYSAENGSRRPVPNAPALSEIADTIRRLVERRLLEGRVDDGSLVRTNDDLSFIWKAWFRPTDTGRKAHDAYNHRG